VRPAILIAAIALLAGCASAPPAPVPTTPSPAPTAAALDPSLDADTLFVISATTTAADGSTVDLVMTGHASQPFDARPDVADAYVEQCTALGGGVVLDRNGGLDEETLRAVGSSLMVIDTHSSPAGTALSGGVDLLLGNTFYTVVATGDGLGNPYQDGCNGGYQLTSTGMVTSITNYETGSPTPDLAQWRSGRYGFSIAFDSTAVLSDCEIVLTPLAIENDVADIDGWFADGGSEHECAIGYRGA
jgi:hypothetical protein